MKEHHAMMVRLGYNPSTNLPRAVPTMTLPVKAHPDVTASMLHNARKRPTLGYMQAIEKDYDLTELLNELMVYPLQEGPRALTAVPRRRGGNKHPMDPPAPEYTPPAKYLEHMNSPQWTLTELMRLKVYDYLIFYMASVLPYWQLPSYYTVEAAKKVSPRNAIEASGLSTLGAHRLLQHLYPDATPAYPTMYQWLELMGFREIEGPVSGEALRRNKTPVYKGAHRKPMQHYGLTLPKLTPDGKVTREGDTRPLFQKLIERPSYGDSYNPRLISLLRYSANILMKSIRPEHFDSPEEFRDAHDVFKIIDGTESITDNPANHANEGWPSSVREVAHEAMKAYAFKNWESNLTRVENPDGTQRTTVEKKTADMLAVAMMHRALTKYKGGMRVQPAEMVLGISKLTGITPMAFLNYMLAHRFRTGVTLFNSVRCEDLLSLLRQEYAKRQTKMPSRGSLPDKDFDANGVETKASARARFEYLTPSRMTLTGLELLIEEVEAWLVDNHSVMSVHSVRISTMMRGTAMEAVGL